MFTTLNLIGMLAGCVLQFMAVSLILRQFHKRFDKLEGHLQNLHLAVRGLHGSHEVRLVGNGSVERPYDVVFTPIAASVEQLEAIPLHPAQLEWLRENGPFELVTCQALGSAVEYLNPVTGKTVKITPGAGLPEAI